MWTFRIDCSHIEFISFHASNGKIELNRRMSPDSSTFYFILSVFAVGLLQGFMKNSHESGNNSPGMGTFSRDLTKTKSLQCRDFTWALHMEKSISPLFLGPLGDVVANDWCMNCLRKMLELHAQPY